MQKHGDSFKILSCLQVKLDVPVMKGDNSIYKGGKR